MSLKLNSSGGGSVTLQEPNTASNFTVDLPAASGTVALTSQLPAGGVTSLNGQTGAITNTDYLAIGSYLMVGAATVSSFAVNVSTTYAGTQFRLLNVSLTSSGYGSSNGTFVNGVTGTWRMMGGAGAFAPINACVTLFTGGALFVRVS
jgi:hypothetical protein